jgi:hypothetical protein
MASDGQATGSCLCGAIRFVIRGLMRPLVICHCVMCQRSSSYASASTACRPDDLTILAGKPKWFRSSPTSRRGFCARCGSNLFWEAADGSRISVSAGSLDQPTGLQIGEHIFTDHKGDYDRLPPAPAGDVTR